MTEAILQNPAPHFTNDTIGSPDSEYDDFLGFPDPCDITIDENGDVINHVRNDALDSRNPCTLPFSTIHNAPMKFKSQNRNVFIPGEEILVKIIDFERSVTSHPLNPNLYTIEFKHGPFTWTIKKRYKHIQFLHNQLKIFRASLNIPFPTKSHRERRSSFKNLTNNNEKRQRKGTLPRFPNRPDVLVSYEHISNRIKALEDYLDNLLKIAIYRQYPETVKFLECSHLSFVSHLGPKGKEGIILKRTGSSSKSRCNFCGLLEGMCCVRCAYFCATLCGKWNKRHLLVKDTFIAYIRPDDGRIKCVILIDQNFEVSSGMYATGLRNGLQIINSNHEIIVKGWTRRQSKEWMEYIQRVKNDNAKFFVQANPHKSFAPLRSSVSMCWLVDGSSYMAAVADALESATEEIFIADWWLSPEIFLKRPAEGDYWRLDKILERKALAGVKVFVMIYKEVEVAIGINSYYSKQRLVERCPENIKVLRHPDHARVGVFLWAHHEKIVVIDQTLAFVGGIDLCYGRWDTKEHRLTDLGSLEMSTIYIPSGGKVISTSSSRKIKRSTDSHILFQLAIATNTIAMATTKSMPVMPVAARTPPLPQLNPEDPILISPPQGVENIKCNTPDSQRKSILSMAKTTVDKVKYNVRMKRKEWINIVYNSGETACSDDDETDYTSINPSDDDTDDAICRKTHGETITELRGTKLWLGKDYTNFIVKDFNNLESPYQDLVDRSTTPRMPWHDVGVMVYGPTARDIARHFIQRWNAIKTEKAKLNKSYPFLLPKSYNDFSQKIPYFLRMHKMYNVDCQVLRSVSSWSAGFIELDTVEQSIHEAYIHAISNAERYIYIENQFFITLATMDSATVKNRIGETLLKRILRAHREGAVFRVFVIMPLLPGFEGEVGGPTGTALHAITHWNYASISRGKDAILNKLRDAGVEDPSKYITFHGLRTHSVLNGTAVTELIYVHSKLCIIDDKLVICGSANINDRSMLATRDSEIAVIIQDRDFIEGRMNGTSFPCGKFAGSLRKRLLREHLGLLWSDEEVDDADIVKESFYQGVWKQRSSENTEIFEDVFHCIPTDKAVSFSMLRAYQKEEPLCMSDKILARCKLDNIRGQLVDFPLNFLCNEVLKPTASSVEGMMPQSLWT